MMKTLFLIPARGGSKGIPGKNIKPFCGTPLIALPIAQALSIADDPADVCVSTDDEAIARVAAEAAAPVAFMRPAALAADSTPSRDVILHALDFYAGRGISYDRVVLLQPTSPLRNADDIRRTISAYDEASAAGRRPDMAVTVCLADANPYYNAFEADADGFLHLSKGDGSVTRRQDAPDVWQYNGAVYVISADALRHAPMSRFQRIIPVEMPSSRSVDLDTPADWLLAEYLCKNGN